MQWNTRSSALSGLGFCVVVGLLAAVRPAPFGRNQAEVVLARSEPHDSQNLSSEGVYDPNPNHLWNRLYRQFYVRRGWDGREYGGDVVDPLLWGETGYLVSGPSHKQALSVLDEFLSTHGERLITDSVKRAMLQRDLWAVFEWASDAGYAAKPGRQQLERRLAQAIQRLALSPEQIQALPGTYSVAAAAKAFPIEYNPNQHETAFLPPDLLQPGSAWVNLGNGAEGEGAPTKSGAPAHTAFFGARSLFLVFIRLPGGRDATLAYIKQLNDFPKPCVASSGQFYMLSRGAGVVNSQPVPNPDLPQFPRGTQVLLLRRVMLIDREGQLRPTGLVESVQMRVSVDILSRAEWLAAPSKPVEDVFEFRLGRRRLFAGESGGLRPVAHDDREFAVFMSQPFDGLERRPESGTSRQSAEEFQGRILDTCAHCHGAPGVQSLAATRTLFGRGACTALKFYATSPEEQAEATIEWKLRQYNWGLLRGLWLSSTDWTTPDAGSRD